MVIYAHIITPRLQYISDFIGKEISKEPCLLTADIELYLQYTGPKINYSSHRTDGNEFFLQPHSLLFEKNIQVQKTDCFEINSYKIFFKTEGDFAFDIFAATFYLLSRYEEYLPYKKDSYGRYAYENSLAFKEDFLHLPLINLWLEDFKKAVKKKFPDFPIPGSHFQFLPTYDIDQAWSYQHKGWLRNWGGAAKNLMKGQWSKFNERFRVLRQKQKDPFDSYHWMDELHKRYKISPVYFFHVAKRNSLYDKNISPEEPAMRQLIRQHAQQYDTGIHPSWQSGNNSDLIGSEIKTVEKITGKRIQSSRQHYIRFILPETFRLLIRAEIENDYSMGYGSINGFRASVASPFYWYDLEREHTTSLMLYPFCYMDANSFFEQKYTAQQALDELRNYKNIIQSVNGKMMTIWHNNFLGTDNLFKGWKEVYEQFIKETV